MQICSFACQEESAQGVQKQLVGAQQQQDLVQDRLNYSNQQTQPSAASQQPHHTSSQSAASQHDDHPAHLAQRDDNETQAYLNGQASQANQEGSMDPDAELDMDFEPPGSATGDPNADPFGPYGDADQPVHSEEAEEGHTGEAEHQHSQADDELYSPGLPNEEPSGSYMADASLQSELFSATLTLSAALLVHPI